MSYGLLLCKQHPNLMTKVYFETGFSKILVGLGDSGDETTNTFEIIDLDSSSSECQNLPNFTKNSNAPFGGLGPQQSPVICGYPIFSNQCTILVNGTWQAFGSLLRDKFYPSVLSQPPFGLAGTKPLLMVTGGISLLVFNFSIKYILNSISGK